MSKALMYAANSSTQTIADGNVINFGSIIKRFGRIDISGGNIITNGVGYYDIDVNLTIVGTSAGSAIIQIYSNGVMVPGACVTVATTANSTESITIPAAIRQKCCASETITVKISGISANVTNAAILIQRV